MQTCPSSLEGGKPSLNLHQCTHLFPVPHLVPFTQRVPTRICWMRSQCSLPPGPGSWAAPSSPPGLQQALPASLVFLSHLSPTSPAAITVERCVASWGILISTGLLSAHITVHTDFPCTHVGQVYYAIKSKLLCNLYCSFIKNTYKNHENLPTSSEKMLIKKDLLKCNRSCKTRPSE